MEEEKYRFNGKNQTRTIEITQNADGSYTPASLMAVDSDFNPAWSFDHATTGTVEYNNGILSNISDGYTLTYHYSYNGGSDVKDKMFVIITFKLITITPTPAPSLAPTVAPTETIAPTASSTNTPLAQIAAPRTGDNIPLEMLISLIIASFAIAGFGLKKYSK